MRHLLKWTVSVILIGWIGQSVCKNAVSAQQSLHEIRVNTEEWVFPAEGVITDIFLSRNAEHKGIDIGGKAHSPIYSVDDGRVTRSYFSNSYGNVVFIKHKNGYETVYAHLEKRLVSEGQAVKKGEKVGEMGNTGHSTGNHLHFEVHAGEWTVDKVHAFDPFFVFGERKIGDHVFAFETSQTKVVETVTKEAAPNTYEVQAGDTLFSISQNVGISVEEIIEVNGIKNKNMIKTGQILTIEKGD